MLAGRDALKAGNFSTLACVLAFRFASAGITGALFLSLAFPRKIGDG
jgi:hypothetical protein